jgi:hypothetical protein
MNRRNGATVPERAPLRWLLHACCLLYVASGSDERQRLSRQVCLALVAVLAGIPQNAGVADEPEPIKSAFYAGVDDSFKACLKKVSREYFQEWSEARTGMPSGLMRFDVLMEFKPIGEASKLEILTRLKRGLNYCKDIREFVLKNLKAEVGEPTAPVPLQTLIAKETEEMLTADVKHVTDGLYKVIFRPNGPSGSNFIKMIGILKELDRYRRQVIAEVFTPP